MVAKLGEADDEADRGTLEVGGDLEACVLPSLKRLIFWNRIRRFFNFSIKLVN